MDAARSDVEDAARSAATARIAGREVRRVIYVPHRICNFVTA